MIKEYLILDDQKLNDGSPRSSSLEILLKTCFLLMQRNRMKIVMTMASTPTIAPTIMGNAVGLFVEGVVLVLLGVVGGSTTVPLKKEIIL